MKLPTEGIFFRWKGVEFFEDGTEEEAIVPLERLSMLRNFSLLKMLIQTSNLIIVLIRNCVALRLLIPGVNFINILLTSSYTHRSQKRKNSVKSSVSFTLLGSTRAEAANRTLVKSIPGFIHIAQYRERKGELKFALLYFNKARCHIKFIHAFSSFNCVFEDLDLDFSCQEYLQVQFDLMFWFNACPNFCYCPSCLKNILTSKVVASDIHIIISNILPKYSIPETFIPNIKKCTCKWRKWLCKHTFSCTLAQKFKCQDVKDNIQILKLSLNYTFI